MKFQCVSLACVSFILMISLGSCKSGTRCHQEVKEVGLALDLAFDEADSIQFLSTSSKLEELLQCVEESKDLSIIQKGEADAVSNHARELSEKLACRCFASRMQKVFDVISGNREADEETWNALYARWEKTNESIPFRWKELIQVCSATDAKAISSMKSQVETWNGYRTADGLLEDLDSGIEKLKSTSEGFIDRLKDAVD